MIYVGLPIRDEATTLGPVLWKIRRTMTTPEFRRDFHIVALDDASTDDSRAVLERYRESLPLTVITSDRRLGYGLAVDRLLREVTGLAAYPKRDAAVVLQADFTEDPAAVVDLIKRVEGGADIVAGAATPVDGSAPRPIRWARRLAPWVLGRAHAAAPVRDPLCGFRAYRVIVLKKALVEHERLCSSSDPWCANLEILGRTAPHARRVEEVEYGIRYALHTRASRFRAGHTLRALARRRGLRWPERPTGEVA